MASRNPNDGRWEGLMDEMAACRFEGPDGKELLCDALRSRLSTPTNEAAATDYGLDPMPTLIGTALRELGFVERGL